MAAYQRFLDNDLLNVVNGNELEYDEGVIVEFQFYGLGGTGKQLDTLLDDAIDDYDLSTAGKMKTRYYL